MAGVDEVTTMSDLERVPQPIGPRIRVAREQMGLSVEELASRIGVRPESVAGWEADSRAPRANRLLMLAGILNVSLGWLLEGREDVHMEAGPEDLATVRQRIARARLLFTEASALLDDAESALARLGDAGH